MVLYPEEKRNEGNGMKELKQADDDSTVGEFCIGCRK